MYLPTVQTAIRTVHLSNPAPPSAERQADGLNESASTIEITERPGLNNSTGQRLWDCAIGLTAFLSQYPAALEPDFPLEGLPDPELSRPPPAKRFRQADTVSPPRPRRRLRIVELGAGCALASMVAAKLLSSPSACGAKQTAATMLATDVETTVESTLKENLRANGLLASSKIASSNATPPPIMIESAVLDWGRLSDEQLGVVLGHPRLDGRSMSGDTDARDDPALTILATDVLYNPESHPLLLATLLSLLRPTRTESSLDNHSPRRALVAYKRRTEGDDGFFPLAREAGLEVDKVWEWGEVGVWAVT